jgi:DNA-directed RNA polymerase specialized sigma24 family protein
MPAHKIPLAQRFWAKVDKSGPCQLWQGRHNSDGYGEVTDGRRWRKAHRVAWELTHGPIPPGMCVCHRCDTRLCCHAECDVPGCPHTKDAPDCQSHLFLGTNADNIADREAKGRGTQAIEAMRQRRTKLTPAQVTGIRERHQAGVTYAAIAAEFGCSRHYVHALISGRRRQRLLPVEGK